MTRDPGVAVGICSSMTVRKEWEERLARIRRRRKLGRLKELVVARKTALRYRERVEAFLAKRRRAGKGRLETVGDVDRAVEAEIGDMWWQGDPKSWAADLVSGVQHFYPRCRKRLVSAWRLYGAWNRLEYPNRAPPMDLRLALAVAGRFWRQGRRRTAVAVLLGFHCYIRSGELLGLRRSKIVVSRDGKGVVSLGVTKGKRIEMVTIDDPGLGRLLRRVMEGLAAGERLMDTTEKEFRQEFSRILKELGLERMAYKPYSMRRGGATEDFREHGSMDRSLLRGRWKSAPAARQYILEGVEMYVRLARSAKEELLVLEAGEVMRKLVTED